MIGRTTFNKGKTFAGRLTQPFSGDGLRAQVIRGGVGSIIVKILATGLSLLVSVLLARMLGPEGYGVYSYVLALVAVMIIPAQFGLPELVIRETAKALARSDWGVMRGIWRWTFFGVTVFSFAIIILVLIFVIIFAEKNNVQQLSALYFGLLLVPIFALTRLYGSIMQGLRKTVHGQIPDAIIRPMTFIVSVSLLLLLGSKVQITAGQAMALQAICALLTLAIAVWIASKLRPTEVAANIAPVYHARKWIGSALPLAFVAGMSVINTQADLIMLGVFMTPADVGIYRIAVQGSTLVSFSVGAIAAVSMPYYAQFYACGEMSRLQRLATAGARVMTATAIPIMLIFVFFGEPILHFVFGVEYISAYPALAILSVSHVVHAGFGILGPLLNMAGHERIAAIGIACAAACNIILNYLLIPLYGLIGAAAATGATLLIWNIALWYSVRTTIGIDTTAISISNIYNY